jgi:hypothetical protein
VLVAAAPALADARAKPTAVPFKLTDTLHLLVRVKIDGKGPFNLIIDTGAPAVFVSTAAAKKAGLEKDKKGWGVAGRFEIEGGVVEKDLKVRVETPFQLEGMNAMGTAGAELHGVIGYTLLARYKMDIDLTRDRMLWTKLDFEPPALVPLGKGAPQGGLEAVGAIARLLGALVGKQPPAKVDPRGFLGVELEDGKDGVAVRSVFAKGPAAQGGLQAGDRITEVEGKEVRTAKDVQQRAARVTAGQAVRLSVLRGGDKRELTVTAGEGL